MTRHLSLAAAIAMLTGCSATRPPETTCHSLQCITQRAQQPIIRECVRDLQFYALRRTRQQAIDRKYQYPLTNADTYAVLSRMGGTGPSPRDWCEAYAERRARVVMPGNALGN